MKVNILLLSLILFTGGCVNYSTISAGNHQVDAVNVSVGSNWNQSKFKIGNNTTLWTKDGHSLNQIIFSTSVKEGNTLFKSNNKELPLPKYKSGLLLNELAEFVTSSMNNFNNGEQQISILDLRPQKVSGAVGARFGVEYFDTNGLKIKGEVLAVPEDESLNVIIFTAAKTTYYGMYISEVQQMMDSVTL